MISEELSNSPLFYTLEHMSSVVHSSTPSIVQVRSAIIALGYQVSGSHASKTAIKTDAPTNGTKNFFFFSLPHCLSIAIR